MGIDLTCNLITFPISSICCLLSGVMLSLMVCYYKCFSGFMEQLGRGVTKARRSFCLSEHAFSSHIINEFTFPITPWCMDIFNLPETDESTNA